MSRKVLVTGASGFIAAHIVDALLQSGWDVHGTVRSLKNEKKVNPIRALAEKEGAKGTLELFEADLLQPGSFNKAMERCTAVVHTASPCPLPEEVKEPESQLLKPALEGTRNVLESVNQTPTVLRVVITSSEAAARGSNLDIIEAHEDKTVRESHWNETATIDWLPYAYSKTMAEREAWKMAEAQSRWKLVTILPGVVIGPNLTPDSSSGSLNALGMLMNGTLMMGTPDLPFPPVDVRDVALAHVRALGREEAHGRYLIASDRSVPWLEMADMLRPVHPSPWKLPKWTIPGFFLRTVGGLLGISRRYVDENLGIHFLMDVSRSIKELGITYRPLEQSLADHCRSWVESQNA
ncbi:unnamed protein product [Clonostachys rosea f. rosea IK726]|uniref:NAD-dependent epimerase/dehydratase domain-containing protein n=2 Tax=Bionectria ochroleuca TaxID=29856 RepID=A0A0B7K8Q5_BIOOC|nr:unnamed protein product [Clonostachys rosea f. rosea IK726]